MSRVSYSKLSSLPAYGLYKEELVASVRAESAEEAAKLFKEANLKGTIVRRIKK